MRSPDFEGPQGGSSEVISPTWQRVFAMEAAAQRTIGEDLISKAGERLRLPGTNARGRDALINVAKAYEAILRRMGLPLEGPEAGYISAAYYLANLGIEVAVRERMLERTLAVDNADRSTSKYVSTEREEISRLRGLASDMDTALNVYAAQKLPGRGQRRTVDALVQVFFTPRSRLNGVYKALSDPQKRGAMLERLQRERFPERRAGR